MISKNVMKTDEYSGTVMYKFNCGCNDDDHITTIEFDYHKDSNDIDITFYKKMSWDSYWNLDNWYERLWSRIKVASKILFTGWIEVDTDVIIKDEEHITSFIEALQEGKNKMIECRDKTL